MDKTTKVLRLIQGWMSYTRASAANPESFDGTRRALYQVRNPGYNGSPPLSAWPKALVDPDDEIMAAVEHYYLCRYLVGTGRQPAWQMKAEVRIYDLGKKLGITPATNPGKPVTPASDVQAYFQDQGIRDGEKDLAASGGKAPLVSRPVQYTKT